MANPALETQVRALEEAVSAGRTLPHAAARTLLKALRTA